jgi:hypothetical protein
MVALTDRCAEDPRELGVFAAAVLFSISALVVGVRAGWRWWLALSAALAVVLASGFGLVALALAQWAQSCTR